MEESNAFVFYQTVEDSADIIERRFGKEEAYDYLRAVIGYGLHGIEPPKDHTAWVYGLTKDFLSIDYAKKRRKASIEDGKMGGRPRVDVTKEQILETMENYSTWKEVACALKIDEDTLRKLRKNYEIITKPSKDKNRKTYSSSFSVFPDFNPDNSINEKIEESEEAEKPKKPKNRIVTKSTENNSLYTEKKQKNSEKTEKPKNLKVEEEVEVEVKEEYLFNSSGEKTEKTENLPTGEKIKITQQIPRITKKEANELMFTSDRALYPDGNYLRDEDSDDVWMIISDK